MARGRPRARDRPDHHRRDRARRTRLGAFAGEFLILNGIFSDGWGWAVVGAIAIVLAAMYMLRLDLGRRSTRRSAPPCPTTALDLRAGRDRRDRAARRRAARPVASGRPAITDHASPSFSSDAGLEWTAVSTRRRSTGRRSRPILVLLGGAVVVLLVGLFLPTRRAPDLRRGRRRLCLARRGDRRDRALRGRRHRPRDRRRRAPPRPPRRARPDLRRGAGLARACSSACRETGAQTTRRARVLRAPARRRSAAWPSSSPPDDLIALFLGLEWFSISLYVLSRHRRRAGSAALEAGLKYLIVGSFGSAILLFGSAFVYGATGAIALRGHRRRRRPTASGSSSSPGWPCCSSGSRSSSPRRRSTCGRPTSTRARPRP